MTLPSHETRYRWLFTAAMLASCWFAFKPGDGSAPALGWDKADHWAGFAVLALTLRPAWPRLPLVVAAALLIGWGAVIELIQTQVPGRDGSWGDLLADSIGVAAGLALHRARRWLTL